MTQALQKGFQVTSEREALIIKKTPNVISFNDNMVNKGGEGFILTKKVYKSSKNANSLEPKKGNPEGKSDVWPEGTAVKQQEKKTTKRQVLQKIYANKLYVKLGHPGEYKMRVTSNNLHYSVKGMLEV